MWETILEAIIDTLKIVPVLALVYLLISYFEHNANEKFKRVVQKTKGTGPIYGSALGLFPNCGFSTIMADLYSKRAITLGTLIAVFLTTSDEAIPLFFAHSEFIKELFILIGIKLIIGISFGYIIDLSLKLAKTKKQQNLITNESESENHSCNCGCHANNGKTVPCCTGNVFYHALVHTLKISAFILAANLILNITIFYVGLENFISFFNVNKFLQPFIAGIVGIIPNCAASVFLVELYIQEGLTFAALIAGLTVGSGVGLLVLFKNNKYMAENLIITALLYSIGVISGIILTFIPFFN